MGSGEGEHLPGGVGVAPGATEPQPVNKKAEEEFEADPPWRQAKEKAEREAAEHATAEREATQKATAEHEAAQQAAEAAALRCVVPSIEGKSLAAALRSLHTAHCSLGKVSRSHGHHGALVVNSQSPKPGKTLASEAPVKVTLGSAKRRHG